MKEIFNTSWNSWGAPKETRIKKIFLKCTKSLSTPSKLGINKPIWIAQRAVLGSYHMLVARLIEVLDKLITSNSLKAFIFTGFVRPKDTRNKNIAFGSKSIFWNHSWRSIYKTLDDAVAWRHTMMSLQKPSSTNQKQ